MIRSTAEEDNSHGASGSVAGKQRSMDSVSSNMRAIYKREPLKRVFVNRNLRLEKIQFFGFDMDYTLAEYKSPQMEQMTFGLVVDRLISIGYPEEFRSFEYNYIFPIRGLWFDTEYGNLLKVDGFGSILVAIHGFKFLKPCEIEEYYPNKFIHLTNRVYVLNTLFNLPETYLVACVINYFDKHPSYHPQVYSMFTTTMKNNILSNLDEYVNKDERVVQLLTMLRQSGRKIFLLTNSDYSYTNGIMSYLLGADWMSFFDITVVDARKPLWFCEGTVFREVDTKNGSLKIGIHTGPLRTGAVYSGGSCDAFRHLVKARGKDVLYVGDHIFGDVLRSKKTRGWRTFLVVPELDHELRVWTGKQSLFDKLRELDSVMADVYKNLDNSTREKPKIHDILSSIRVVTHEMDQEYGVLGSLFRSGSRTTFFASQVERYADLYASSCYNLIHYPNFYFFRAPMTLMPHESTVDHAARMQEPRNSSVRERVRDWNHIAKSSSYAYEDGDEHAEDIGSSGSSVDPEKKSHRGNHRGNPAVLLSDVSCPATPSSLRKSSSDVSLVDNAEDNDDEKKINKTGTSKTANQCNTDVIVPKSSYVDEE